MEHTEHYADVQGSIPWSQTGLRSASSSGPLSPAYSVTGHALDRAYSSPTGSTSYTPQQHAHHASFPHSPTGSSNENTMMLSQQIPGSIGPARAVPRRMNTRARSALHGMQRNLPSDQHTTNGDDPLYYPSTLKIASRPQTPSHAGGGPAHQNMVSGTSQPPLSSPQYMATFNMTSNSPLSYYPSHSRSNSASNSTNPRSTSPSSTVSALTSISSSGSAHNSHTYTAYPLPTTPGGLVAPRSAAKPRKQRLYNVDRKNICIYHRDNPNARQEDIAAHYGVERSTISKILKQKAKWMNLPDSEDMRASKQRPSKFPEVEGELVTWLQQMSKQRTLLTDASIRNKAKEIAQNLQIPEERFKASSGWVENFKHRHNIKKGVWAGQDSKRATVLSPLNPAFESRAAYANSNGSSTMVDGADDDDIESTASPHDGGSLHANNGDGDVSMSLPQTWRQHNISRAVVDGSVSSVHSSMSQGTVSQSYYGHSVDVLQGHQHALSSGIDTSIANAGLSSHHDEDKLVVPIALHSSFDDSDSASIAYGELCAAPKLTHGDEEPPLEEVDDALTKTMHYINSHPDIISREDRDALLRIKHTIFQALGAFRPDSLEKR